MCKGNSKKEEMVKKFPSLSNGDYETDNDGQIVIYTGYYIHSTGEIHDHEEEITKPSEI